MKKVFWGLSLSRRQRISGFSLKMAIVTILLHFCTFALNNDVRDQQVEALEILEIQVSTNFRFILGKLPKKLVILRRYLVLFMFVSE